MKTAFVVLAGLKVNKSSQATSYGELTRTDVEQFLDTAHPEAHCQEHHDHTDSTYDDWRGALLWASTNCGHNEGAGAVIKIAVEHGLSYPELMQGCTETEREISLVDDAMKNPDSLDRVVGRIPPEKVAALKEAIKQGKSFTDILVMAPEEPVGAIWSRKAMVRFARNLVRGHAAPAVAIATASQWHNCHGFKCLLRHPDEVAVWLKS